VEETILILTIRHKKPLPDKTPITDIAGQRLYSYLYSQGVEASVRASLVPQKPEEWEVSCKEER
jgi:hypothetical protein